MSNYTLGVTGIPSIEHVRRQIQLLNEQVATLDTKETIAVLHLTLLLHIYDGLDTMDTRIMHIETLLEKAAAPPRLVVPEGSTLEE